MIELFILLIIESFLIARMIVGTPHITASGYPGDISDNIEAATYWAAHPNSRSNCVRIPKGVHQVSKPIVIAAWDIKLDGKGSVLQCTSDFDYSCLNIQGSNSEYSNIHIEGPFKYGLSVYYANNLKICNNYILHQQ